jgi:hypothetical protein
LRRLRSRRQKIKLGFETGLGSEQVWPNRFGQIGLKTGSTKFGPKPVPRLVLLRCSLLFSNNLEGLYWWNETQETGISFSTKRPRNGVSFEKQRVLAPRRKRGARCELGRGRPCVKWRSASEVRRFFQLPATISYFFFFVKWGNRTWVLRVAPDSYHYPITAVVLFKNVEFI